MATMQVCHVLICEKKELTFDEVDEAVCVGRVGAGVELLSAISVSKSKISPGLSYTSRLFRSLAVSKARRRERTSINTKFAPELTLCTYTCLFSNKEIEVRL